MTLFGHGLYGADTWLVGAGNQGHGLALLLVDISILLLVVAWYRRGGAVASAVYAGVLAFFTYLYVSMVFATAQNRLFPLYVAAAVAAGAALIRVVSRIDVVVGRALPERPGRRALSTYLLLVAAALTVAWLPLMMPPP